MFPRKQGLHARIEVVRKRFVFAGRRHKPHVAGEKVGKLATRVYAQEVVALRAVGVHGAKRHVQHLADLGRAEPERDLDKNVRLQLPGAAAAQVASALSTIKGVYLYLPLAFAVVIFFIMCFYKLNSKNYNHIVSELEQGRYHPNAKYAPHSEA